MTDCPKVYTPKSKSCSGCPLQKICSQKKQERKEIKLPDNLKILLVMSGKGGVGKSTMTVNIAKEMSKTKKVCVLDLDISGPSLPRITSTKDIVTKDLPVKISENFFCASSWYLNTPLIENLEDKYKVIEQLFDVDFSTFDYLVMDTPPGIGDEHLFLRMFPASKIDVILVTSNRIISLNDFKRQLNFIKKVNWNIWGAIINMSGFFCSCGKEFGTENEETLQKYFSEEGISLLGKIPLNQKISKNSDFGIIDPPSEIKTIVASFLLKKE